MAANNADDIQQRIQIARRDAESLKDRIKRTKDELADTSRKFVPPASFNDISPPPPTFLVSFPLLTHLLRS